MKDQLRIIGLAATVAACSPVAGAPPTPDATPDISYRDQHYIMSYSVPTTLGDDSGFTCYTEILPQLVPVEAVPNQTQVTLRDATCDNNDRVNKIGMDITPYTPLEDMHVTPGQRTEIIIFSGQSDQISVVSQ